jgi:hypothetical protein
MGIAKNAIAVLSVCFLPLLACSAASESIASSSAKVCTTAGLVSDAPNNFAAPGTQVTWTASAGCDQQDTPTFQFWELPPGGSWTMVQDWGTANTWSWDTTNNVTGVYNFQVWVRANGSQAEYETYSSSPFTLANVTDCTGVGTNVSPNAETSVGDPVSIASTASCGNSTAEYEIWIQPPNSAWSILSAYDTSNGAYTWDTTSATSGSYYFQVWARAVGSPNDYDTYSSFGYVLDSPCSSASLAFSPNSTAIVGTSVTATASASCGGTPYYKFYQLPPGGSWTIVQDWSATANYTWDTTNAIPGTYYYQVWVRNSGSQENYEQYAPGTYELTSGTPCTDGTLGGSPTSPQSVGTQVTLTGGASTCSNAEYQFWELPAGSSTWTMVQDWSTTSTYAWDTTGDPTGTYSFQAWVREAGSTGSYETYGSLDYQLN